MRGGSVLSVGLAIAWRQLHNSFTNPALLLPALLFPIVFFLGFAGGLSRVGDLPAFDYPPGYTTFQYAFVLLQASAMGGVFTGFHIARDFEHGFARRLLVAAPRRSGVLLGYVLATPVRIGFNVVIVTAIALVVGMNVRGGSFDLVALFALAFLVNVASTLWAAGVALRLRSTQAGPVMQLPIFLLLFLAPVFVPIELLHGWLHAVAVVNPISTLLEAARELLAGTTAGTAVAYATVLGLGAVLAVWALRGMRRAAAAGG